MSNVNRTLIVVGMAALLILGTGMAGVSAIEINCVSSPDNADALTDFSREFMGKYPDIKVKIVTLSWEAILPKCLADFVSHTGAYDIMTWDVMTGGAVSKGLADLEEIRGQYPEIVDSDYDIQDFIPTAWHVFGMWGDKNIGLPWFGATQLFYYRKDYFQQLGIEVPTTWEEALKSARLLTREYNPNSPSKYGIALMFAKGELFYNYLNWFGPLRRSPAGIAKFGEVDLDWGDYFTQEKKPAFNSPEGVKALELMEELMPYSLDPVGSVYGETMEYFGNGIVGMVNQWPTCIASWKTSPALSPFDEKVGVAMMPGGHAACGGWGLGINNDTPHKKEAYMWIQFATNKEHDKLHWLKYNIAPSRYSTCQDPEVLQEYPWFKDVFIPSLENGSQRTRIPEFPKLEDITVRTLAEILLGRKPTNLATLQKLADEWTRIVEH